MEDKITDKTKPENSALLCDFVNIGDTVDKSQFETIKEKCPWSYTGQKPYTWVCSAKLPMANCRPYSEIECKIGNCAILFFTKNT